MADSVSSLIQKLVPDLWRAKKGFSSEIEKAHQDLFDPRKSDEELSKILAAWLQKHQPCLFGRMAAGPFDLLSFCILTEDDLMQSDKIIREKIQRFRLLWKQEAFQGLRSGFVILAVSQKIATAMPDQNLQALAFRICSLYLREEIEPDRIHHDRLTLEIPATGSEQKAWYEWLVGANYFSSQGDMRWWHDHRIPGGLAFSMNSVGHMARNGALQNMLRTIHHEEADRRPIRGKLGIDSLGAALKFAMLTINGAQDAVSGKATCLRKLSDSEYGALRPACPIQHMPPALINADYTTYLGWYHTDASIPSDYFRPDVQRPAEISQKELDFRYLFDDDVNNPDFERAGSGIRIR